MKTPVTTVCIKLLSLKIRFGNRKYFGLYFFHVPKLRRGLANGSDHDASYKVTGFKRTMEQNTPATQRKQKIIMQSCMLARKEDCVLALTGWFPMICLNTRVMMVMLHSIPTVRMVAKKLDAIP